MKILFALSILLVTASSFAQTTTYSKEEENMVNYVANGRAYPQKYDSVQNVKPVLDSCRNFLKKYPNSFAKPNIFAFMLEMTVLITKDTAIINPLIDSIFYYDKLAVTEEGIGEMLITKKVDIIRGRNMIIEALPNLTVPHHVFNAYLTMAKSDITLGNYASAKVNYKKALQIDSTRTDGWYEYLSFLKMMEMPDDARIVMKIITKLENEKRLHFISYKNNSLNISKNVFNIPIEDLDRNQFEFNLLKGKVIVVDRFNFWCGFCAAEFPLIKKMIKEFPEVEFVFIDYGETAEELRQRYFKMEKFSFLKDHIVLFMESQFDKEILELGVPQMLLIDKQGTVRYDYMGFLNNMESLLRNDLQKLVHE